MPFEIRIVETFTKSVPRQDWTVLSKDENGREERGWTPPAPDTVKVEEVRITRLDQIVDTLDIVAVIKAINEID